MVDSSAQVFGGRRGGRVAALFLILFINLAVAGFALHREVVTPPRLPLHGDATYPTQVATEMARCPQIAIIGDGLFQRVLQIRPENDGHAVGVDPFSGQTIRRLTSLESQAVNQCRYALDLYGQLPDKTIALIYDDGPSATWTPQLLSILQQFHVPANFFTIGDNVLANQELFEYLTKHEVVGNHTLHHPDLNKLSGEQARQELLMADHAMAAVGQYQTKLFRQPYGGDDPDSLRRNVLAILVAQQLGKVTVGATFDPADFKYPAGTTIPVPELTKSEAIELHDAGGDRSAMLGFTIKLIQQGQAKGYRFITFDQLLPVSTVSHGQTIFDTIGYVLLWLQSSLLAHLASTMFWWCTVVIACLTAGTILLALVGNWRQRRRYRRRAQWHPELVTVLIAAYKEEKVIERTIRRIFQWEYPFALQLVVVNDGSPDGTSAILDRLATEYSSYPQQLLVVHQANSGKGGALNNPIQNRLIKGSVLVTIDADTLVDRHTIPNLVRHFEDPMVGAVAGRIKVLNYGRTLWSWLLATWQQAEYNLGIGLTRMAQATLDAVMIVPGACSAWRTRAVTDELPGRGGFPLTTMAEDADLGMVLRWRGYKIVQDLDAVAYTEVPMTWRALTKQQLRWTFGIYQVLYKHSKILARPMRFGPLAYLVMPYALLGTLIPTVVLPVNYLLCALALATGNWRPVVMILIVFTALRVAMSAVAMITLREWSWDPLTAVFYRLLNDPLQIYLAVRSMFSVITGRAVAWGKVPRYGDDTGRMTKRAVPEKLNEPVNV
jgi:biofilm PGA synthesis N-glycosyltransferase PgaC